MKSHNLIPTLIIMVLSLGCSHDAELFIKNENGSIAEKYIIGNDNNHNIKYTSYHINGNIKEEGFIHSGLRIGVWKQYYSDGIIRWQGKYRNGEKEKPSINSSLKGKTKIIFKGITKDKKYAFRFKLPDSISPDELMYTCNNAEVIKIDNIDSCDFLIGKLNSDTIHLQIYAIAEYGVFNIFDKKIDPSVLKSMSK